MENRQKSHQTFKVSTSGLILNPVFPHLGSSPDGICSCDCCGHRVLEIKCPYKHRFVSPTSEEALSDARYCLKSGEDNSVSLDHHHSYYTQVQGHLLVTGMELCDFVCWTQEGLFVETIKKDYSYLAELLPKLRTFYIKYILPELLTHHRKDSSTLDGSTEDKYCYCHRGEEGRMIACDNPYCKIEWFHYSCVGIKRKPKGNWYCKDCQSLPLSS